MRLRPYLANRSLMASISKSWVVWSFWTARSLNCLAASGRTWAAINCLPSLPGLVCGIARLGVWPSAQKTVCSVAAAAWAGVTLSIWNVRGVRFFMATLSAFASFGVCGQVSLQVCLFFDPSEEVLDFAGGFAMRIELLGGAAVVDGVGVGHEMMQDGFGNDNAGGGEGSPCFLPTFP